MTVWYCKHCDSDCYSVSELFACERRCEIEDRNTRSWFANYNPHRKD